MKYIKLTRGYFTIVDDEDFDWLNQWKWSARKIGNTVYAARSVKKPKSRNSVVVAMHREILGLKDRLEYCDHIDHNGLNNQRSNLRKCTPSQNIINIEKRAGTTSKFRGVCYYPNRDKFMAYISKDSRRHYLGWFHSEQDAAAAYNAKARELHGEFATMNDL